MLNTVTGYLTDLFELVYPNVCLACSQRLLKGEEVICFKCESELPFTHQWNDIENPLMQRFWGRVPLQGGAALLPFEKGEHIQHLLHQLKYRGRQDVGEYMGKMFGELLKQPESIIKNIDLVVPV